jgi:putative transposase
MEKILLEPGNYYHIYNRGNNSQNIFFEDENYTFFLNRYDQYISPFCDTIAWVLLRNHFHFLIYVKEANDINSEKLEYSTVEIPKKLDVHLQFGHLFNSYAKAINKRYNRTGSLFEKNFERKRVDNSKYLKNLIHYIHHNPVKHLFTEKIWDYPWSSYGSIISHKPTKLNRKFVLEIFENEEEFKLYHLQNHEYFKEIKDLLIE